MNATPIASTIDPAQMLPATEAAPSVADLLPPANRPAGEKPSVPSLKTRAIHGSAWTTVAFAATQALRLLNALILSYLLLPQDIGLMVVVTVFLTGIEMLSDVGTGPAIIHSKRGDKPEFLNTAWTIHVVRGFAVWIVACLIAWPASASLNEPRLLLLLPICGFESVILGFNSTSMIYLNRKLQLGRITALEIAQQLITMAATIAFCLLVSQSVWALVFANFIGYSFLVVTSHFLIRGYKCRFAWNRADAKSMYRFGRWVFIGTGLMFLTMQADKLLLTNFLGIATVGIYHYANQFATLPLAFLRKMGMQVGFPMLAEIARDRPEALFGRFLQLRLILVGFSVVVLVPLIFWGDDLVDLLFRSQWHSAGWMLQVLAAGGIGGSIIATYTNALLAIGKTFHSMILLISQLVLLLTAATLGFIWDGERGFVIGVAFVQWLNYPIVSLIMARHRLWQPQIDLPAFAITAAAVALALSLNPSSTP